MGWQSEQRVQLVRQLRAAATECGVESVPDNASRVRVRAMADAVLASTEAAHAGPQKQVRKLFKAVREHL